MKNRKLWVLFVQFFKFGCLTFGGGLSIVAQMQQIYGEKQKVITSEELLDLTGVARTIPGMMVGNTAMLFGYRQAGIPGGFICLLAMVVPPMIIIGVITGMYTAFRENPYVVAAMFGIRASVVPIIFSAMLSLLKSAFRFPPCYFVAVLSFVLFEFFNVSCVYLVIIGAVLGLVISGIYERRESKL